MSARFHPTIRSHHFMSRLSRNYLALFASLGFAAFAGVVAPAGAQNISLGTAANFAVLGGSGVTNTGPTVATGNVGVAPGTSITGFPPGTIVSQALGRCGGAAGAG